MNVSLPVAQRLPLGFTLIFATLFLSSVRSKLTAVVSDIKEKKTTEVNKPQWQTLLSVKLLMSARNVELLSSAQMCRLLPGRGRPDASDFYGLSWLGGALFALRARPQRAAKRCHTFSSVRLLRNTWFRVKWARTRDVSEQFSSSSYSHQSKISTNNMDFDSIHERGMELWGRANECVTLNELQKCPVWASNPLTSPLCMTGSICIWFPCINLIKI